MQKEQPGFQVLTVPQRTAKAPEDEAEAVLRETGQRGSGSGICSLQSCCELDKGSAPPPSTWERLGARVANSEVFEKRGLCKVLRSLQHARDGDCGVPVLSLWASRLTKKAVSFIAHICDALLQRILG